jgi:glucosamine-6-phosphate deaminase
MTSTRPSPRLVVVDDSEFACAAADVVQSLLPGPAAVLGVATGNTPRSLYRELAVRTATGRFDLTAGSLVALDEYVGLSHTDPRSYAAYVRTRIARPLGVDEHRVLVPDGAAPDPVRAADDYERSIGEFGGVDVQIAGIGTNGHLAFNEPGSDFASATRVVDLSTSTRHDNAVDFGGRIENVPSRAITQGLATMMRARAVVLLVRGRHKANALATALTGPVNSDVPASVLRLHARVTVVADRAAAPQP